MINNSTMNVETYIWTHLIILKVQIFTEITQNNINLQKNMNKISQTFNRDWCVINDQLLDYPLCLIKYFSAAGTVVKQISHNLFITRTG